VLARRLLGLVVAVAALIVAAASVIRTTRSFYGLDFPVSWLENGLQVGKVVEGTTADSSGLQEGELIVAVDGTAVDTLEDPVFVLAVGTEHHLTVLNLAGELNELHYRPPPPVLDPVYLARTGVAVLGLACAVCAAFVTRRREVPTFLLLAAAALLLGAIPHRTAASLVGLKVLHRAAGAAVPFLLVRFFAVFPERRWSMRVWDALTVVAVAGGAATALTPGVEVWGAALAPALRVLFALALVVGAGLCVQRWRAAAREARIRRQIEWAALGLFVGIVPYLAVVTLPRWLGVPFEPFSWMAVLPIVAIPVGFLAGLTEYRLWDLEPIARDSISATLVVVVGGLTFAFTNHLLLSYGGGLGAFRNLLAFATGVLVVVLLQPVRQQVQRFLDQWLRHGRLPPHSLLTDSTHDMVSATDSRELLRRLSDVLHEGLEFELVATYLRSDGAGFVRVTGPGEGLPERLAVEALDAEFPTPREQALRDAGYAVRMQLERAGTVHGLLYLGLRRGIYPLGSEGREVVRAFAAQAALALESARRLDELRRQAEEYRILHANTQRIIESSAAAILVCDATGRILSANSKAAAIFGHDSRALVGETLEALLEVPASWKPQLPMHVVNAEADTLSQPSRRVIMAVSVLELDSGSFNGRVVVLQDVTEIRDLQDRLREQERLASLGRLASGLAHEINTPLTGIASFAQMLGSMTSDEDPRAQLVSKLVDQSFRVSRIVSNLREAVRGRREAQTVFDLAPVVERAAEDAARSLGAAERVSVCQATGPVMVTAAQGPVELAVSNLVRNAIEASPPDSPVTVEVAGNGEWGEVRVEDRGPGVPEELREKVFEPFVTTKMERGGTGLGLAITRDMITQLGGEVTLASAPGGGTRATIKLRRWEAPAQSS